MHPLVVVILPGTDDRAPMTETQGHPPSAKRAHAPKRRCSRLRRFLGSCHLDHCLHPLERKRRLVERLDEASDSRVHLWRTGETLSLQGSSGQDAEPDLEQIEPSRMRRGEMDADVSKWGKPEVVPLERYSQRLGAVARLHSCEKPVSARPFVSRRELGAHSSAWM